MQRLVETLAPGKYAGPERRQYVRHALDVPVLCLPLGSSFQVAGDPFEARTRNISSGGICLLHTRHVQQQNLALDFGEALAKPSRIVMQVIRTRALGLYYEIAGPFVSRFSSE